MIDCIDISFAQGADYSAFGLTLRVALRAIAAAARRRRTVLFMSAARITADQSENAVGRNWIFSENWLPGTELKSRGKHRKFKVFLISRWSRYPQQLPLLNDGCYRTLSDLRRLKAHESPATGRR
jgi:hypothetical protein